MPTRMVPLLMLAAGLTADLAGQVAAAPPPRLGSFEVRFDAKHPLGSLAEITRRLGWRQDEIRKHDKTPGYDLAEESFFVHVPANYRPDGSFGLLVWISPAPQGHAAADWPRTLARHQLIHVGPHRIGNDRFVWYRIALALDAVHNMQRRYRLDPDRIYVHGHSGGGRTATTLAMLWPDVFDGGIYANGTNHFRKIRKPGQQFYWPARFPKPRGPRLRLAQRTSRHVFVNGERDFNRVHSGLVHDDLRRHHGFRRTSLVVMAGKGHEHLDAVWLGKAIAELDRPLFEARKKAPPPTTSRDK